MWNNNSGFLGGDNAKGFGFDNNIGFDNNKGFDNTIGIDNGKGFGFDNSSGLDNIGIMPFDGHSQNQDHIFQCRQRFTGSRLEACLRGEPWEGNSRGRRR